MPLLYGENIQELLSENIPLPEVKPGVVIEAEEGGELKLTHNFRHFLGELMQVEFRIKVESIGNVVKLRVEKEINVR